MSSTSNDWCRKFAKHPLFKTIQHHDELSRNSKLYVSGGSGSSAARRNTSAFSSIEAKCLLAERDGEVFLWDCYTVSVLTTSLKALAFSEQSARENSDDDRRPEYQVHKHPLFKSLYYTIGVEVFGYLTKTHLKTHL